MSGKPVFQPAPLKTLMEFYDVENLHQLIRAQERHVFQLQQKLPKDNQPAVQHVRNG